MTAIILKAYVKSTKNYTVSSAIASSSLLQSVLQCEDPIALVIKLLEIATDTGHVAEVCLWFKMLGIPTHFNRDSHTHSAELKAFITSTESVGLRLREYVDDVVNIGGRDQFMALVSYIGLSSWLEDTLDGYIIYDHVRRCFAYPSQTHEQIEADFYRKQTLGGDLNSFSAKPGVTIITYPYECVDFASTEVTAVVATTVAHIGSIEDNTELDLLLLSGGHGSASIVNGMHSSDFVKIIAAFAERNIKFKVIAIDSCFSATWFPRVQTILAADGFFYANKSTASVNLFASKLANSRGRINSDFIRGLVAPTAFSMNPAMCVFYTMQADEQAQFKVLLEQKANNTPRKRGMVGNLPANFLGFSKADRAVFENLLYTHRVAAVSSALEFVESFARLQRRIPVDDAATTSSQASTDQSLMAVCSIAVQIDPVCFMPLVVRRGEHLIVPNGSSGSHNRTKRHAELESDADCSSIVSTICNGTGSQVGLYFSSNPGTTARHRRADSLSSCGMLPHFTTGSDIEPTRKLFTRTNQGDTPPEEFIGTAGSEEDSSETESKRASAITMQNLSLLASNASSTEPPTQLVISNRRRRRYAKR